MKKENAKTRFGQFVAENYPTMRKFAKALNEWYGTEIVKTESHSAAPLGGWANGTSKPRQKYEVWSITKKYIRAVHGIRCDDSWLNKTKQENPAQDGQQQISFPEMKIEEIQSLINEYNNLNYFAENSKIEKVDGLYEKIIDGKIIPHPFPHGNLGDEIKSAFAALISDIVSKRINEIKQILRCN